MSQPKKAEQMQPISIFSSVLLSIMEQVQPSAAVDGRLAVRLWARGRRAQAGSTRFDLGLSDGRSRSTWSGISSSETPSGELSGEPGFEHTRKVAAGTAFLTAQGPSGQVIRKRKASALWPSIHCSESLDQ